jgi:opacity protein-like surface antigen
MRRYFLIIACASLVLWGTPAYGVSDDKSEANRLFVSAAKLIRLAEKTEEAAKALHLYEEALLFLNEIIDNHPGTDLAVKLISDQSIGSINRKTVLEKLQEDRKPETEGESMATTKPTSTPALEYEFTETPITDEKVSSQTVTVIEGVGSVSQEDMTEAFGDPIEKMRASEQKESDWKLRLEIGGGIQQSRVTQLKENLPFQSEKVNPRFRTSPSYAFSAAGWVDDVLLNNMSFGLEYLALPNTENIEKGTYTQGSTNFTLFDYTTDFETDTHAFMFNAAFRSNGDWLESFHPYIGGGVGYQQTFFDVDTTNVCNFNFGPSCSSQNANNVRHLAEGADSQFAYQFFIGADYDFYEKYYIGSNFRYFHSEIKAPTRVLGTTYIGGIPFEQVTIENELNLYSLMIKLGYRF